jgi:hypothetical protein
MLVTRGDITHCESLRACLVRIQLLCANDLLNSWGVVVSDADE